MHRPHKHGGKISFVTRHYCKLDPLELKRELPGVAPFASSHRKFLYNFQRWSIASHWNPNCNTYFRSNFALFKERRRHLRNKKYRMIIHPLSRFALIHEMIVCMLWIIIFFLDPLFSALYTGYIHANVDYPTASVIILILNCVFLLDIALHFFIGYTVSRTKEIVLEPKRIAKQYFNTYFFHDLIPAVFGILLFMVEYAGMKEVLALPTFVHVWLSIPQVYILRFVRLYTVSVYFSNMLVTFKLKESLVKCSTIALVIAIVIHWWTCTLYLIPAIGYFIGYPFDNSWVLRSTLGTQRKIENIYIECLLCTVCHFFGAGKGNILTENPIEQLILALILMCGITCHIYVIAIILQLFGTINVSETKYEELIYQLNEYMVTKKLPQGLRKRLLMYYEYRFQKQFFLENLILNSLSEHLRYEVLLYSCKNLINKVKLFQGAPKEVIGALVAMLKHEIFLPNDHIIKPDAINEHVYFISFGTVSVYLANGKEAYHLEDGHHFGEVQVVLQGYGESYQVSVMAIEITEVFYLDTRDFWYVVATHPEIADSLEKSALTKLAVYKSLDTESVENVVDTSDILMELRRGHILDRGRKRR
mgnify:CR=1 FL=1